MSKLERILIGGREVWIEVSEVELSASGSQKTVKTSRATPSGPLSELTNVDVSTVLSAILEPMHVALEKLKPEEASVEISFGIKGEIGFFVAKSEGNAAIKVSAKWKFDNSTER